MHIPSHAKTWSEIEALRAREKTVKQTSEWSFELSQNDFKHLFERMPANFKEQHQIEFDDALKMGLGRVNQLQRMYAILDSDPMIWLKRNKPAECADSIRKLVKYLRPELMPELGKHLISGSFVSALSQSHP